MFTCSYSDFLNSKHSIFQGVAMFSGPPHSLPQRLRFSEFSLTLCAL